MMIIMHPGAPKEQIRRSHCRNRKTEIIFASHLRRRANHYRRSR